MKNSNEKVKPLHQTEERTNKQNNHETKENKSTENKKKETLLLKKTKTTINLFRKHRRFWKQLTRRRAT